MKFWDYFFSHKNSQFFLLFCIKQLNTKKEILHLPSVIYLIIINTFLLRSFQEEEDDDVEHSQQQWREEFHREKEEGRVI